MKGFFDYEGTGEGSEPLDFLTAFGSDDWEALLAHTQTERFDAGHVVLPFGGRDRALYIIGEGMVEVVIGQPPRTMRIATCNEGDVFGEQVFLDGEERSAEVRALTAVRVIKLPFEAFEAFAAHYPDLARVFLLDLGRIISLRLRATNALVLARR